MPARNPRSYDVPGDMTGFGRRLLELRKRHGLSQEDVGEKIGVSQSMISAWENGKNLHNLPVPTMVRLARAFRVDPGYFFTGPKGGPAVWIDDNVPAAVEVEVRKDLKRRAARRKSNSDAEGSEDGKSGQFKRPRKRSDKDED